MLRDQALGDDASANQMFLNDSLENRWVAACVPRALGVDDGNRAAFADPKAVRLRAENAALFGEPELLQSALQELPRRETAILLAALRSRLIAAEENVPPRDRHANRCGDSLSGCGR